MRPFQIILLAVFAGFALLALVFFMFYRGSSDTDERPLGDSVTIWGTLDKEAMNQVLIEIGKTNKDFQVVRYEEKDPRSFDDELLNAIAESRSPDLIILPHDTLVKHRAKLFAISYDTISERDFRDMYVDGAEIFMRSDGIYGLPFAVDPLVMYWNRDIFSSSGLAAPPTTWESLAFNSTPAITRIDTARNISQSAVAFGEYMNIRYAKEILSMLFLQAGSSIVEEENGNYAITLNLTSTNGLPPADAAISFYTQFAIPGSQSYSWSRSLPSDRLQFLGGDLGMYFGLGSEYPTIQNENPNLNFDIAPVPQGAGATTLRDYGVFYAFAIPRAAVNRQGAFQVALTLSNETNSELLSSLTKLAPARRSLIAKGTSDPYQQVLYQSALISRGWLDPDPELSGEVFRQMIEDVTSGRSRITEVVDDTVNRLRLLFR